GVTEDVRGDQGERHRQARPDRGRYILGDRRRTESNHHREMSAEQYSPERRTRPMTDDIAATIRRLKSENLRLREDVEVLRERLAYVLSEVATLRRRVADPVQRTAAPGATKTSDPLVRLFEALKPQRS